MIQNANNVHSSHKTRRALINLQASLWKSSKPRDQMKNFDDHIVNVRMKNTGVLYIIDHGPSIMDDQQSW